MNLMEHREFERLAVENDVLRSTLEEKDRYIGWLEDRLDELEGELREWESGK